MTRICLGISRLGDVEALDEVTDLWALGDKGRQEPLNVLLPAEGLLVVEGFGM